MSDMLAALSEWALVLRGSRLLASMLGLRYPPGISVGNGHASATTRSGVTARHAASDLSYLYERGFQGLLRASRFNASACGRRLNVQLWSDDYLQRLVLVTSLLVLTTCTVAACQAFTSHLP
jgi:hypothetical protein